jgi:hypothetical protein
MREIRQSGSVRGVRRNPYPYRDSACERVRRRFRTASAGQVSTISYRAPKGDKYLQRNFGGGVWRGGEVWRGMASRASIERIEGWGTRRWWETAQSGVAEDENSQVHRLTHLRIEMSAARLAPSRIERLGTQQTPAVEQPPEITGG